MQPSISIVIASGAGGEFLFRCLESVRDQARAQNAEILVVDRVGEPTASRVALKYPEVRLLRTAAGERRSVPQLRRRGALEARAPIVAVIEEHCTAPPHWLATIRAAFGRDPANSRVSAAGGPILDDGFRRVRDWVVYFSEYHNFLPPWPDGERYLLNGANIAYERGRLLAHRDVLDRGYWEVVLHPLLAKEGRMLAVARMGVHHTGPFDFGYYLEQRRLLSRVWGGTQRDVVGPGKRLFYLIFAPLFPFLLLLRIAARVFQSGARVPQFLRALPLLVPVAFAYVWGEWLGYLLGPGDALERVE